MLCTLSGKIKYTYYICEYANYEHKQKMHINHGLVAVSSETKPAVLEWRVSGSSLGRVTVPLGRMESKGNAYEHFLNLILESAYLMHFGPAESVQYSIGPANRW